MSEMQAAGRKFVEQLVEAETKIRSGISVLDACTATFDEESMIVLYLGMRKMAYEIVGSDYDRLKAEAKST
jgi:GTP-binding protein EngB required for normal cell division